MFLNLTQLREGKRKQYPNPAFGASPPLPPSLLRQKGWQLTSLLLFAPSCQWPCSYLQWLVQRQRCGSQCSWRPISPWNRGSKSTKLNQNHHSWNHLQDGLGTFAVKGDQGFSDKAASPCPQGQARYPWENYVFTAWILISGLLYDLFHFVLCRNASCRKTEESFALTNELYDVYGVSKRKKGRCITGGWDSTSRR